MQGMCPTWRPFVPIERQQKYWARYLLYLQTCCPTWQTLVLVQMMVSILENHINHFINTSTNSPLKPKQNVLFYFQILLSKSTMPLETSWRLPNILQNLLDVFNFLLRPSTKSKCTLRFYFYLYN
jgi:hypothetical protein